MPRHSRASRAREIRSVLSNSIPAALGGSGRPPAGSLGAGTADSGRFLRGDQTWTNELAGNLTGDLLTSQGAVYAGMSTIDPVNLTDARHHYLPDKDGTFATVDDVDGARGLRLAYVAKTGTYAIQATDCIIHCTSGTFTVTLPTASLVSGRTYIVRNSGAGTITLATTLGQTIDGAAPGTVAAGGKVWLTSDGSNWFTI